MDGTYSIGPVKPQYCVPMVYLLNADVRRALRPTPPERRRAVILGAGPTGVSAAFHLGEHSLLLEQRTILEEANDQSNDFPMGAAGSGAMGSEEIAADSQRPGVSATERKALFISCGGPGSRTDSLIHVVLWKPPELATPPPRDEYFDPPARDLVPLLRGELRLGTRVVRVTPSQHLIDLADGARIVYDKLLSTLPLSSIARMVMHELPGRVRRDEVLRYWLAENDIEVADRATQECYGDIDEFAAGKRAAHVIGDALKVKFCGTNRARASETRLFVPRLVEPTAMPAMS